MNTKLILIAGSVWLLGMQSAGATVDAAKGLELAKNSNCMACHTVEKKLVGPAYQDVAKKYKGDKNAEAMLIKKVKEGGAGVWGPIPMPANGPKVSDADIKTLVEWVLAR
jgi:cytochrome c